MESCSDKSARCFALQNLINGLPLELRSAAIRDLVTVYAMDTYMNRICTVLFALAGVAIPVYLFVALASMAWSPCKHRKALICITLHAVVLGLFATLQILGWVYTPDDFLAMTAMTDPVYLATVADTFKTTYHYQYNVTVQTLAMPAIEAVPFMSQIIVETHRDTVYHAASVLFCIAQPLSLLFYDLPITLLFNTIALLWTMLFPMVHFQSPLYPNQISDLATNPWALLVGMTCTGLMLVPVWRAIGRL